MRQFSYDSDLTGGSLMVRESRVIAQLLLEQATRDQWHEAVIVENQLQKTSPATARRVAQAIRKRLEKLTIPFWKALRDGDDELATQVAFCAALARNLLLLDFVESVVKDAFMTRADKLEAWQWSEFLEERAHRDPSLASWSAKTQRKAGQVAFRILSEVGLLTDTRTLKLQHLLVRSEVRVLLEEQNFNRIQGCLDVSTATGV